MKTITLLGLAGIAFVSLSQPTWAGPRGGGGGGFGGGGHVGGGGRIGGFAGGGSRAAPAFYGGGFRGAPASRGAYFTGRGVGGVTRAPRFYYGGNRMTAVRLHGFTRSVSRSPSPSAGRATAASRQLNRVGSVATAANRQPNRVGSTTGRNRISDPRTSTAANRQSFLRNHAPERHDANWHRDWDRHHAHFDHNRVFVFVDSFWWGLYPWDYYPYYAYGYYPYDDYGYNPYDYSANPYDYYDYYPYSDEDQPTYADSGQSAENATVSTIQSALAKRGYYSGVIDGVLGDETEAALARYQEDQDLSVTGTVNASTLRSLGVR
jgi:Putative peptidoglycan binding domain